MRVLSKIKEINFQRIKLGLHCVQAVLASLGCILSIVVIAKPGGVGSATWWFFALVSRMIADALLKPLTGESDASLCTCSSLPDSRSALAAV